MKKHLSYILVLLLLLPGLSACDNDPSDANDSAESYTELTVSVSASILTEDTKTVSTTESRTSITEVSKSSTRLPGTTSTSGATSTEKVSSTSSQHTNTAQRTTVTPPALKQSSAVSLAVDTSRAPSTDVGSQIWNGYIYYLNPAKKEGPELLRRKLSGGEEQIVLGAYACDYDFQVLDGKVYYKHLGDMYRCDADGRNPIKLYDGGDVRSFQVAGKWVFAICYLNEPMMTPKTFLYLIKTDGSVVRHATMPVEHNVRAQVNLRGFNRGYAYYSLYYEYTTTFNGQLCTTFEKKYFRFDYRSDTLAQQRVTGIEPPRDYCSFSYDRMVYGKKSMSLIDHTESTILETNTAVHQAPLQDGFVYHLPSATAKILGRESGLYFTDNKGNVRVRVDYESLVNVTYSDNWLMKSIGADYVLLENYNSPENTQSLWMVKSDGTAYPIYHRVEMQ